MYKIPFIGTDQKKNIPNYLYKNSLFELEDLSSVYNGVEGINQVFFFGCK